jgi:arsenate reductase
MAEGMINKFSENIQAFSSGVQASGKVNPNAKRILERNSAWKDEYHSKTIDEVIEIDFDLVVTVCDHAKETCPIFPKPVPKIHVGFEDPDGKPFEEFSNLWEEMKEKLLPVISVVVKNFSST